MRVACTPRRSSAGQTVDEWEHLGPTPVVETPSVRRGKPLPMFGTQFVHVGLAFWRENVDPNRRGCVLEFERDLGCLTATAASTGAHAAKVRNGAPSLVDISRLRTCPMNVCPVNMCRNMCPMNPGTDATAPEMARSMTP